MLQTGDVKEITIHFRAMENQELVKIKFSRCKNIIIITAEINVMEIKVHKESTKQRVVLWKEKQKIHKLLGKLTKIYKLLDKLAKGKGEKIQNS